MSGFLRLSAFVLSVCHRLSLTVLLSVCVHQCLAAEACVFLCVFSEPCLSVCMSRTWCVCCLLCLFSMPWRLLLSCVGLGCLVLSCVVLSSLVLSACHRSVLSLCCVYSSSRSPSLVCPVGYSVYSVFSLFLHPSKASRVQVFSHAKANKAQKLTIERLSKENTDRTRDPQVCSVMTPAKLSSDDPILRSSATPV